MIPRAILVAFLLLLTSPSGWTQTDVGRLVGVITDATGAVISGASVRVKNERTGEERTVLTAGNGTYTVLQLPASLYTVTASLTGFSETTSRGVAIQVG